MEIDHTAGHPSDVNQTCTSPEDDLQTQGEITFTRYTLV